jgi:hypothetical protein
VVIITVAVGLMGALQAGIHQLTTEDWKVRPCHGNLPLQFTARASSVKSTYATGPSI